MPTAWLALGGNLGDVERTFEAALGSLDAHPQITVEAVSTVHRTTPIGNAAGTGFHNAAARAATSLAPRGLLEILQRLEVEHGRDRTVHWGPRTLDLDVLLFDDLVRHEVSLAIPHPALWYRRFVLDPLVEIAGDVVHPVKRVTIRALRERLLVRPLTVGICGGTNPEAIAEGVRQESDAAEVAIWNGATEPTLLAWLGPNVDAPTFEDLPRVPRLDVSHADNPAEFLRLAVRSALG